MRQEAQSGNSWGNSVNYSTRSDMNTLFLLLTIDPPIPADKEIEQGAQEGQEDDKQDPQDFVIAMEIIHQGRN